MSFQSFSQSEPFVAGYDVGSSSSTGFSSDILVQSLSKLMLDLGLPPDPIADLSTFSSLHPGNLFSPSNSVHLTSFYSLVNTRLDLYSRALAVVEGLVLKVSPSGNELDPSPPSVASSYSASSSRKGSSFSTPPRPLSPSELALLKVGTQPYFAPFEGSKPKFLRGVSQGTSFSVYPHSSRGSSGSASPSLTSPVPDGRCYLRVIAGGHKRMARDLFGVSPQVVSLLSAPAVHFSVQSLLAARAEFSGYLVLHVSDVGTHSFVSILLRYIATYHSSLSFSSSKWDGTLAQALLARADVVDLASRCSYLIPRALAVGSAGSAPSQLLGLFDSPASSPEPSSVASSASDYVPESGSDLPSESLLSPSSQSQVSASLPSLSLPSIKPLAPAPQSGAFRSFSDKVPPFTRSVVADGFLSSTFPSSPFLAPGSVVGSSDYGDACVAAGVLTDSQVRVATLWCKGNVTLPFYSAVNYERVGASGVVAAYTDSSFVFGNERWMSYRRNHVTLRVNVDLGLPSRFVSFKAVVTGIVKAESAPIRLTAVDTYASVPVVQYSPDRGTVSSVPELVFSCSGEVNAELTFPRIQFASATNKNGGSRAVKRASHFVVSCYAKAEDSDWQLVSVVMSLPLCVRGRSPSNYVGRDVMSPVEYATFVEYKRNGVTLGFPGAKDELVTPTASAFMGRPRSRSYYASAEREMFMAGPGRKPVHRTGPHVAGT